MARPKGYKSGKRPLDRHGGRQAAEDDGLQRGPGTMATAADDYVLHLRVLNRSDKTTEAQRKLLLAFLLWAQERDLLRPEQITRSILEAYQRHLYRHRKANGKPLGIGTQRNHLSALKRYFSWLCRQRRLEANPASELILPKMPQRLPAEPLSADELNQLLAIPDVADPLGIRDRAILETLYSTALRRFELAKLTLADLRPARQVLTVRSGKGDKDRVVPVGKRALHWLETYRDRARPVLLLDPGLDRLFLSCYGQPFTPNVLGTLVARYLRRIDRNGGCHLFRHTCATHMLEGGADLRYVQEMLGHADVNATAVYTRVSVAALKAVHARTHPAEQQRAVASELPAADDAQ